MEEIFLFSVFLFQVPLTIPLFPEYLAGTEPSNSLDVGHDDSDDGEINIYIKEESNSDDKNLVLNHPNIGENIASANITSDIKGKVFNSTKSKLFSYKKKLNLIKDANSAISLMKKSLNKNAVVVSTENDRSNLITSDVKEIHEEHNGDDITSDDKIELDEQTSAVDTSSSSAKVSSSGVWDLVKTLSEKSGLVSTDGGFINIKPLVNMTVNTFGLFDGVNDGEDKPFDPTDTKTVLKSIFQIWNPRVSFYSVTLLVRILLLCQGQTIS